MVLGCRWRNTFLNFIPLPDSSGMIQTQPKNCLGWEFRCLEQKPYIWFRHPGAWFFSSLLWVRARTLLGLTTLRGLFGATSLAGPSGRWPSQTLLTAPWHLPQSPDTVPDRRKAMILSHSCVGSVQWRQWWVPQGWTARWSHTHALMLQPKPPHENIILLTHGNEKLFPSYLITEVFLVSGFIWGRLSDL